MTRTSTIGITQLAALLCTIGVMSSCENAPRIDKQPKLVEEDLPTPVLRTVQQRTDARTIVRENGLKAVFIPGDAGELARVTLWVRGGVGRDRDSKPGLAELSARALMISAAGVRPGVTLNQSLLAMGARMDIDFEGEWVLFEVTCRAVDAQTIAKLLFGMVTQERPSNEEIDLAREEVKARYARSFSDLRRQRAIARLLGEPSPDVALEQEALKSYGATEVRLFVGIHYRPNHSMLVVQTARPTDDPALEAMTAVFDPWRKGQPLADLVSPDKMRLLGHLERDGPTSEVTAVLVSPAPELTGSIATDVAWQLFDRDGVAGLLRKRLDERGFREVLPISEDVHTGRNQVRTLRMEVPASQTTALIETIKEALLDLEVTDPTVAEFRRARQRSQFLWNRKIVASATRARTIATAVAYADLPDIDGRVLDDLSGLKDRMVTRATRERFVPIVLVRGPASARPNGAEDLPIPKVTIASVLDEWRIRPIRADQKDIDALAKKGLEDALFAIGGRAKLQELPAFEWRSLTQYQASIPIEEAWKITLPAGDRKRTRTVLGSTVETTRSSKETVERLNRTRRVLGTAEREYFDLEALSNPGALFALVAQKSIQLELEGRLDRVERPLLFYIWRSPNTKPLRVGIDAENGLPRRIDTWAWRPNAVPQRITWTFHDYRVAGGLRLPHLAQKYVEGQARGELQLVYPGAEGAPKIGSIPPKK